MLLTKVPYFVLLLLLVVLALGWDVGEVGIWECGCFICSLLGARVSLGKGMGIMLGFCCMGVLLPWFIP